MKDCIKLVMRFFFRYDGDTESMLSKSRHAASISGTQPTILPVLWQSTQGAAGAALHSAGAPLHSPLHSRLR